MSKTWFITGASRGFGREFAEAALRRGDNVTATARNTDALDDLRRYGEACLPLQLDVTDRAAATQAVGVAHRHFGRLDIVVNNAGYGHFGFFEETTEAEARAQFETNVFGVMAVTQAALPLMREQGGGHIVQISSIGGVVAFPTLGVYNASKWAVEAMSEALAQEVAPFGVKVTLVEPGVYATDWAGSSATHSRPLPAYEGVRRAVAESMSGFSAGDPAAVAAALLQIVDAEQPPLRVILGAQGYDVVQGVQASRMQTWSEWETLSRKA